MVITMENLLRVGVISSTHGVKGEVKVFPTTDDPERFEELKDVILDTGKEQISLEIENVKYFKQFVILKFKGINNINDIEKYKGKDLLITRDNAVDLEEGEFFICDLIDMDVYRENGEKLGVLTEVLKTGANDVFSVRKENGKDVLLPYIEECVLNINLEENKMIVHVLPGLEDE